MMHCRGALNHQQLAFSASAAAGADRIANPISNQGDQTMCDKIVIESPRCAP